MNLMQRIKCFFGFHHYEYGRYHKEVIYRKGAVCFSRELFVSREAYCQKCGHLTEDYTGPFFSEQGCDEFIAIQEEECKR